MLMVNKKWLVNKLIVAPLIYILCEGEMMNILYCQYICIFNHEKNCQNRLNASLIYKLQDSLNNFTILILLGSKQTSSPFINFEILL